VFGDMNKDFIADSDPTGPIRYKSLYSQVNKVDISILTNKLTLWEDQQKLVNGVINYFPATLGESLGFKIAPVTM
jgi:hypothetical protein